MLYLCAEIFPTSMDNEEFAQLSFNMLGLDAHAAASVIKSSHARRLRVQSWCTLTINIVNLICVHLGVETYFRHPRRVRELFDFARDKKADAAKPLGRGRGQESFARKSPPSRAFVWAHGESIRRRLGVSGSLRWVWVGWLFDSAGRAPGCTCLFRGVQTREGLRAAALPTTTTCLASRRRFPSASTVPPPHSGPKESCASWRAFDGSR